MSIFQDKISTLPKHARCSYEGSLFSVYSWEQETFKGSKVTFEKILRPDTVSVICITDDGEIIINEEKQSGDANFMLTIPTGRVDDKTENTANAALRELKEETGIIPKQLYYISSDNIEKKILWDWHYFVSFGIKVRTEKDTDDGEFIKNKNISIDAYLELVSENAIYAPNYFRMLLMKNQKAELKAMLQSPSKYFKVV